MANVIKKGRPFKGSHRRERMSFTIEPGLSRQVRRDSKRAGLSVSEVIEAALTRQANSAPDAAKLLGSYTKLRGQISMIAERYKVDKLSLFGSLLRGTDTPASDIDLLVEFKSGNSPSLFDFVALESELSKLFGGRKVDLRTYNDLSKYFRDRVLKEAVPVFQSFGSVTQNENL